MMPGNHIMNMFENNGNTTFIIWKNILKDIKL